MSTVKFKSDDPLDGIILSLEEEDRKMELPLTLYETNALLKFCKEVINRANKILLTSPDQLEFKGKTLEKKGD